ncbi:PD-(D/E)XK nuclease family transposase [Clostridium sp.]
MQKREETKLERRHREDLERLKRFRPMDDTFMRGLFKDDIPLAQLVLRIITGMPDLTLLTCETQADMKRVTGARSICLDAYATDSRGRKYDIEVQRADSGADPHRARYHSSVMDVENLDEKQDYRELPDTYVIFITEKDYYKSGEPLYVIEHMNRTLSQPFEDGAHILYVNGEYRGDSALGKLMHDFNCTDAGEMNYELLAQKTRYLKENPKGVSEMCKVMEELRNESYAEGRAEGTFATLAGLVRDGLLSIREASQRVNMTEQEFETALRKLK